MSTAAPAHLSIYDELVSVASAKANFQPKGSEEADGSYLQRLVVAVGQVPEEDWKQLSKDTQEWFNQAALQVNAMQPVTECPGYTAQAPAQPPSLGQQAGQTAPKATKATDEAKPASPASKRGIMAEIRKITLLNPDYTEAQIAEEVGKQGWEKVSAETVWLCRTEVKNVLKAAESVGLKLVKS